MNYPLDFTKNNGVTAAGIAAYRGSHRILKQLCDAGADINITSKQGIGPLYLAIKQHNNECIKLLVEAEA